MKQSQFKGFLFNLGVIEQIREDKQTGESERFDIWFLPRDILSV